MNHIPATRGLNPFDIPNLGTFKEWKETRNKITSTLGQHFLTLTESQLTTIFTEWEGGLNLRMQSESHQNHMSCLLVISLLHYFRRSFEQIKRFYGKIKTLSQSNNRDMVKACARTIRWLGEESTDNAILIRESLEQAKDWLSVQKRDLLSFNALEIIHQVGKIMPKDVLDVTLFHVSEIWEAITSPDSEMRHLGTKVMEQHLKQLPKPTAESFATALYLDSIAQIDKSSPPTQLGILMILEIVYELYPSAIKIPQLLDIFMRLYTTENEMLIDHILRFYRSIHKREPSEFTGQQSQAIAMVFISKLWHPDKTTLKILLQIQQLLELSPKELIPVETLVGGFKRIFLYHDTGYLHEKTFEVLYMLLENVGEIQLPIAVFTSTVRTPTLLKCLKKYPNYIFELRGKLIEWFEIGLQTNSKKSDKLFALSEIIILGKSVFDNMAGLMKSTRQFMTSHDDDVRATYAACLVCIGSEEAIDELVNMAVYDASKYVRIKALTELQSTEVHEEAAHKLIMLLGDSSFKVRRMAIPIISKSVSKAPFTIGPAITNFTNDFVNTNITSSSVERCARACKLLPVIAKYFVPVDESAVESIAWLCVKLLAHGEGFPGKTGESFVKSFKVWENDYYTPLDLRNAIRQVTLSMEAPPFQTVDTISPESPVLRQIFTLECDRYSEMRDVFLFDALGELAGRLTPYVLQIVPVYILTFQMKRSEKVYLAALKSLTSIVIGFEAQINLTLVFPDFIPSLLNLLSGGCSEKVGTAILRLIGTIGSVSSGGDQQEDERIEDPIVIFKSQANETRFIIELLRKHLRSPSISVLSAMTNLIVSDYVTTLPYLGEILTAFTEGIKILDAAEQYFVMLDNVIHVCQCHVVPFIPLLINVLKENVKDTVCVSVCATMASSLGVEFAPYCTVLYIEAMRYITTRDLEYFRVLMSFSVYSIVFQRQSADLFLDAIEQRMAIRKSNNEKFVQLFLKAFVQLLQHRPMSVDGSRMFRIAATSITKESFHMYDEIFANLVQRNIVPISVVIAVYSSRGLPSDHISNYRIDIHPVKRKGPHRKFQKTSVPKPNPFSMTPPIIYNNQHKWIEDLCMLVIENSPSAAIRGCAQVAAQHVSVKRMLFPIAFISVWKETTDVDHERFRQVFLTATRTYETLESSLLELVVNLELTGINIGIGEDVFSRAAADPPLSLYFMLGHLRTHKHDKESIEYLLSLYMNMQMYESARGLLQRDASLLNEDTAARWSEVLGEYEKALEYYGKQENAADVDKIRCLSLLEQWNSVREYEKSFWEMSDEQKEKSAIHMAWAFYYDKDYERVSQFLPFFENSRAPDAILFRANFFISTMQYEKAKAALDEGFLALSEDRMVYSTAYNSQAIRNLEMAHEFIELEETLQLKQTGCKSVPPIWQNRLQVFTEESDSWMTLIKTRSLVLSPSDHIHSCMKMISVLRKERKWRVVDSYLARLNEIKDHPEYIIGSLKILHAKGDRLLAANLMKYLYNSISCKSQEELSRLISSDEYTKYEKDVGFLSSFVTDGSCQFDDYKKHLESACVDNSMRSRILRMAAGWHYNLYKANSNCAISLEEIIRWFRTSIKLNGNDYRVWAGWAYATSRALGHNEANLADYAVSAISGFLRATKLKPSGSLEYLCLMFSILFRYGEYINLSQDIEEEIVKMPADVVIQIIPQIVVHIGHQTESVRRIVRSIITNFSADHFEAVVYALNILSQLSDKSKAVIASDLMAELASQHSKTAADANLFISGMRMAAVSLCERLAYGINRAMQERHMQNKEAYKRLIREQLFRVDNPQCENDRQLIRSVSSAVQRCVGPLRRYESGDATAEKPLWEALHLLFNELDERMKKLDSINLSKVNDELVKKRGFNLAIPGQYSVNQVSPRLYEIEPILQVMNTAQHPRAAHLVDEEGKRWKFLLKGNEDLRLDQRIMQFFTLLNTLLKAHRLTMVHGVTIEEYAIVPFAPDAGLVSWVTGADTLLQLVADFRKNRDISIGLEQDIVRQHCSFSYNSLAAAQRLEVFERVSEQSHANELRDTLWMRSPSPQAWINRVHTFTVSTALMSMAGYVIGLGDRHPSNIMVQRHTGRIIHIDFGESFESASVRKMYPERVPFRLTRMMENALDGESVEGTFRKTCEDVLWVLRENQSPIVAQLEIFVHEPIFYIRANSTGKKVQHSILSRVAAKLSGQDVPGAESEPAKQVDFLISTAIDPNQYTRHFLGWCPFW